MENEVSKKVILLARIRKKEGDEWMDEEDSK